MRYSEKNKIRHKGREFNLHFNENGAMFSIENQHGDIVEWLCSRRLHPAKPNQCYLAAEFVAQMSIKGIVEAVQGEVEQGFEESIHGYLLCNIVHPLFNDQGFSGFGDFCRARLGQQCQYGSRYIDGRLEGYPALGEGLRFNNGIGYGGDVTPLDATDYHSVRIHRDDMDEFERRYNEHRDRMIGDTKTVFAAPQWNKRNEG